MTLRKNVSYLISVVIFLIVLSFSWSQVVHSYCPQSSCAGNCRKAQISRVFSSLKGIFKVIQERTDEELVFV